MPFACAQERINLPAPTQDICSGAALSYWEHVARKSTLLIDNNSGCISKQGIRSATVDMVRLGTGDKRYSGSCSYVILTIDWEWTGYFDLFACVSFACAQERINLPAPTQDICSGAALSYWQESPHC